MLIVRMGNDISVLKEFSLQAKFIQMINKNSVMHYTQRCEQTDVRVVRVRQRDLGFGSSPDPKCTSYVGKTNKGFTIEPRQLVLRSYPAGGRLSLPIMGEIVLFRRVLTCLVHSVICTSFQNITMHLPLRKCLSFIVRHSLTLVSRCFSVAMVFSN